jgi:hypothetical protein
MHLTGAVQPVLEKHRNELDPKLFARPGEA